MKKTSLIFAAFMLLGAFVFAQSTAKHPKNGKTITIYSDGTWEYINETGSFIDNRDKKTYKTVTIGTQVWMAENLAFKATSGLWIYDNDNANIAQFGYLYSLESAKNVCPTGWHLPNNAEWTTLIDAVGGEKYATRSLKSATGLGLSKGNNRSGFNGMPGGYFYKDSYGGKGTGGIWWSSSPSEDAEASAFSLDFMDDTNPAGISPTESTDVGYSVRCIKD